MVFNINTKDSQVINKIHKNQDKIIGEAEATDMDNYSDNYCFGANFCTM